MTWSEAKEASAPTLERLLTSESLKKKALRRRGRAASKKSAGSRRESQSHSSRVSVVLVGRVVVDPEPVVRRALVLFHRVVPRKPPRRPRPRLSAPVIRDSSLIMQSSDSSRTHPLFHELFAAFPRPPRPRPRPLKPSPWSPRCTAPDRPRRRSPRHLAPTRPRDPPAPPRPPPGGPTLVRESRRRRRATTPPRGYPRPVPKRAREPRLHPRRVAPPRRAATP